MPSPTASEQYARWLLAEGASRPSISMVKIKLDNARDGIVYRNTDTYGAVSCVFKRRPSVV